MASKINLENASLMALRDYMGLAAEETLLVITDEREREIGYSLYNTGKSICAEAFLLEMKSRQMHGQEPPEQVADMMKAVDVVICPTAKSLTHTEARRNASKLGVRVATMPGITKETMARCLDINPDEIVNLTLKLTDKLRKTSEVHIHTEAGTEISVNCKSRKIIPSTGVMKKIGESGNLPSGEVYFAPVENEMEGTIVFDGSFAGIGILKNPIKVNIKDGYATRFIGKAEARKLSAMLREVGGDALAFGEFGIGTNPRAIVCGDILEDEKVLGTVHFAFGNNIGMGGNINVPLHLDGIILKPTVYFDDQLIMKDGNLQI
jgi:leucyl aminopeptidase (aminopeptidase T)